MATANPSFERLLANGELIGKFMTYYDEPHAFAEVMRRRSSSRRSSVRATSMPPVSS